ncbi:MAG TPA: hypothetical protein DDY16_08245 [Tenacibaculum sp.]|nr:hypothetical protein [Tenacibaculum sp.]
MPIPAHKHSFIFNDDGFEVCIACGLCSSQREMIHVYSNTETDLDSQGYDDVLINNGIGFISKINNAYLQIKSVLKRGYPNISLYAYCVYNILRQNGVFYSLAQISHMFQLKNFPKQFCHIHKNYNSASCNLDDKYEEYMSSAIKLFLAHYDMNQYHACCLKLAKAVKSYQPSSKLPFIVSVAIYIVLTKKELKCDDKTNKLCKYFMINKRTLEKKISQSMKLFYKK